MGQKTISSRYGLSYFVKNEKIRFGLVGVVNTVVDFSVLLSLVVILGIPSVIANIFSTSCALIISYLLNKSAVFGNKDANDYRKIVLFVIVTLTSLWGIQTVVIVGVGGFISGLVPQMSAVVVLTIAKVIAIAFSLIWNYLWYSRVVFRKKPA
jgi:putative flippase GtrA